MLFRKRELFRHIALILNKFSLANSGTIGLQCERFILIVIQSIGGAMLRLKVFRKRVLSIFVPLKSNYLPLAIFSSSYTSSRQKIKQKIFLNDVLNYSFCDVSKQKKVLEKLNLHSGNALIRKIYYSKSCRYKDFIFLL